ncbi:Hypothetical protein NGAL_HAMBI2566_35910 [Neorhizobium galegae bv. orientalis]|nr:Hypothetical protein NGAL_HAMBI2566_35910 [Neorhizobium galegae bv. orientalis]
MLNPDGRLWIDRLSEGLVICQACEHEYAVGITNTGAGLSADLLDGEGSVGIVNDPVEFPDDELLAGSEQYQIDNMPSDPAQVLQFAVYDIEHVQGEMRTYPIKAVPRMLFTQYFSAVEAYLSDRLIGLVSSDGAALASLVKNSIEWTDEKISVAELAANPNVLKEWVKKRLIDLMYHNFVKIDMYYRGALGSTIFPDEDTKKTLMRLLPVRHDCVHRYGRDKYGTERDITEADLEILGKALQGVVKHIEDAFAAKNKMPLA